MAIIKTFAKRAARHKGTMDRTEITLLSACMNAMLDRIAALEGKGLLGDGFAAMGGTAATAPAERQRSGSGAAGVVVTFSG
jgi:hypothetical protein